MHRAVSLASSRGEDESASSLVLAPPSLAAVQPPTFQDWPAAVNDAPIVEECQVGERRVAVGRRLNGGFMSTSMTVVLPRTLWRDAFASCAHMRDIHFEPGVDLVAFLPIGHKGAQADDPLECGSARVCLP